MMPKASNLYKKTKLKEITIREIADDYNDNADEKSIYNAKGIQPL